MREQCSQDALRRQQEQTADGREHDHGDVVRVPSTSPARPFAAPTSVAAAVLERMVEECLRLQGSK